VVEIAAEIAAAGTTIPRAAINTAASSAARGRTHWRPQPRSAAQSRRASSEQIGGLADQVSEWREGVGSDELAAGEGGRTQAEIAQEALTLKETGETA
jgi:hypothetical protein